MDGMTEAQRAELDKLITRLRKLITEIYGEDDKEKVKALILYISEYLYTGNIITEMWGE